MIPVFFFLPGDEIGGDVAEGGDAEGLGERLELGVMRELCEEFTGEADIVGDHLDVTVAANLLQREPDFEGSKSA